MPTPILMPALSPTMTEGNLATWLKQEGDAINAGDVIAEIETDKATMEVEAVDEGTLGRIVVPAGTESVAVNDVIALLLDEGEDSEALDGADTSSPVPAVVAPQLPTSVAPKTPLAAQQKTGNGRLYASPLARRFAKNEGVDLTALKGTGPHGRIVKADVERALREGTTQRPKAPTAPPVEQSVIGTPSEPPMVAYREVELSTMRKVIARRLSESQQTVPHFYLSMDCQLDELMELRRRLNDRGSADYKLSVNDFVIKAAAKALAAKPEVNAIWGGDRIFQLESIDISVAVAIPGGLITPIVTSADKKSLPAISNEMRDLAGRARDGKLAPREFQGGGFSISNLGMYGVRDFAAVINPPQSGILAVGAGERRPIVKNGELAVATVMTATMSVDHRIVDGSLAAEWLQQFKSNIEDPLGLLL